MATLAQAQPVSIPRRVLWLFVGLLVIASLEAYAVGPVPFEWVGESGLMVLALLLAIARPLRLPLELRGFVVFFLWAALITVIMAGLQDYARLLPPQTTTPYPVYVSLRLASWLSFLSAGFVAYWLSRNGQAEPLMRTIVALGTIIAVLAIYIYFATLLGLPEPPRTRLGTDGGVQATTFSYAFHRALGTFREPSHLAAYLVLPLFLSMRRRSGFLGVSTLLMGLAMLMTGSLTGIVGVVVGFVGGTLAFGTRTGHGLRVLLGFGLMAGLGLLGFTLLSQSTAATDANLIQVLGERVAPIVSERSLSATNRSMTYQYAETTPPPLLGSGLGHANILYSRDTAQNLAGTFQSMFLATLYGTGYPGLILLLVAMLIPLARAFALATPKDAIEWTVLVGAFLGWIVVFAGLYDEPQVGFGILVALMAGVAFREREARGGLST